MGAQKGRTSSSRPYATLEPRVAKVSEAVIRKKWKKLPENSQVRLAHLLDGVARQGLAKMAKKHNTKRAMNDLEGQDEGEEAVVELASRYDCTEFARVDCLNINGFCRLTKRLPRMPFPPRTDERDFDFEGTLHRVRSLENQLTSNIHSIALLKAQIKKEEDALRNDREDLRVLEQTAKDARGLRKEQSRKLHPLARGQAGECESVEEAAVQAPMLDLDLENDKDAKMLVEQLRSHLESVRNNTSGTQEIVDAMEAVQAKLDIFAATALSATQYEMLHGVEVG